MFDLYLSKNCFCDRIVVCGNYFDWHDREIRERFHDSPPLLCRSVEFPSWNQNKNQILLIKKPKKLNSSKKDSIFRLFDNNNKFSIKISAIDPKKIFKNFINFSIFTWFRRSKFGRRHQLSAAELEVLFPRRLLSQFSIEHHYSIGLSSPLIDLGDSRSPVLYLPFLPLFSHLQILFGPMAVVPCKLNNCKLICKLFFKTSEKLYLTFSTQYCCSDSNKSNPPL